MTDQSLSALRRRFDGWNGGNDKTLAEVFFDSSLDRWVVTSHAAVLAIFQARHSRPPVARRCPMAEESNLQAFFSRAQYLFSLGLMFQSSPDTERLRKTMMRHLGANEMRATAARLEESADHLVLSALERGSLEVIGDLATPLVDGSLFSILGVPEEQWHQLAKPSKAVSFMFGLGATESERMAGHFAFAEMCRIVRALMSDTITPKTPAMDDWLEAVRLGTWSQDEALAQIATLIFTGRISPITAIGSMVHHLALCPAAWDAVQSGTLSIEALIEECLRLGPPKVILRRTLWQGGMLGGVEIPPGGHLLLMVGRANRDPAVFDHPLEFDPWRCPKRNLAFGAGSRRCPGIHLAREQMRAALLALLKYFPKLEMVAAPTWKEALNNERVIDTLQIRV